MRTTAAFYSNPNNIRMVFFDKCLKKQRLGNATLRELNNTQNHTDNHTVHSALAAAAMYLDNCKIDKPEIIIIGTKPFKNIITVPFQCY